MKNGWKRLVGIFTAGVLLFTSAQVVAAQTANQVKVNTYSGIVIDTDCSGTTAPEKHTKSCNFGDEKTC